MNVSNRTGEARAGHSHPTAPGGDVSTKVVDQDAAKEAVGGFDVQQAVTTLKKDVLDIKEYFDDIYRALQYWNAGRSVFERFHFIFVSTPVTAWEIIQKEYNCLVVDSRKIATAVAVRTGIFQKQILPVLLNKTTPLSKKRKKLNTFVEDMEKTEDEAQRMSDGFINIPDRIKLFQRLYGDTVKDRKGMDGEIAALNAEIERLNNKLTECKTEQEKAWQTLRNGIPIRNGDAVGDDILLVIGALLGQAGRGSILSKVLGRGSVKETVAQKWEEITETMGEIEDKKNKLKELESHAENLLHVIPGYVGAQLPRTIDICGRLNAIAKIWAVIRTDAQSLNIHLHDIQKSEDEEEFYSVVQEREEIKPLYQKLQSVLYSYANAVAK